MRLPLIAIAAANLPDGRVLLWSSSQIDNFATGQLRTYSAFYDFKTGVVSPPLLATLRADMFCPGSAMLPTGGVMIVGGVTAGVTGTFNGTTWSASSRLNIPRGYNSAVTLSDGRIFTLGGSWSGGLGNKIGEIWAADVGWMLLPQVNVVPFLTDDIAGIYRQDNHMWLIAARSGWVFQAGPSRAMHWISTAGAGKVVAAGNRGDDGHAMNGIVALYDAAAGKVLTAGGAPNYGGGVPTANAYLIDISAGPGVAPPVQRTGPMSIPRAFLTAVVLPNGEVVVVGGQTGLTCLFQDDMAVLYAEVWSPATGRFTPLAAAPGATPMVTPRTYHSVALLLSDGRVLSTGGGACGPLCMYNHLDAQVLTPPYLLAPDGSPAARPTLLSAPDRARPGDAILVTAAGAASFALVRLASSTHTVNTDQRRIPLAATPGGGGDDDADGRSAPPAGPRGYSLKVPADTGVAIAGDYYLFALGPTGTPSMARVIRVAIRGATGG